MEKSIKEGFETSMLNGSQNSRAISRT